MPRSHALLAGLFDYAGLFPPAGRPLPDAMADYARYRSGRSGWMLGRFVVPAASLEACSALASAYLPTSDGDVPWRLSALVAPGGADDAARIDAFNRRHADAANGAAVVDTVEARVAELADVRAARGWAGRGFDAYCEVPLGAGLDGLLDAVARAGLHAKVRTGGVAPESVPTATQLAAFLCGCAVRGVVAKATAGLHHAVTGEYPLTYAADAPRAALFGFLNLVLGAGIAEGAGRAAAGSGEVRATIARLLEAREAPSWVGHAAVEWRGPRGPIIEGPVEQFAVAGRALIRSVGTCSFEEPVDDARRVGLVV